MDDKKNQGRRVRLTERLGFRLHWISSVIISDGNWYRPRINTQCVSDNTSKRIVKTLFISKISFTIEVEKSINKYLQQLHFV